MVRSFPVLFNQQGEPLDKEIYEYAVKFAQEHLAEVPQWKNFYAVWMAAECGEDGSIQTPLGLIGIRTMVDVGLIRLIDEKAARELIGRANDALLDKGVPRGSDVLVYVARRESAEQRCPKWRKWLRKMGAVPADRWTVKVR